MPNHELTQLEQGSAVFSPAGFIDTITVGGAEYCHVFGDEVRGTSETVDLMGTPMRDHHSTSMDSMNTRPDYVGSATS